RTARHPDGPRHAPPPGDGREWEAGDRRACDGAGADAGDADGRARGGSDARTRQAGELRGARYARGGRRVRARREGVRAAGRRKGAMTPVEAQAANMEQMPAPIGQVAVTLATVTRGPVAANVRYTGTAVGYVEQDIYPRTQGWITWMPFYPGDRVHRDQLLAKLDTTEPQERVAERQASERMAEHQAMISRQAYQQSLASAAQAQSEVGSKQGMLQDAFS